MRGEGSANLPPNSEKGWKPKWLYALEFDENEVDKYDAALFPSSIPRFYMASYPTVLMYQGFPYTQMVGANPVPLYCEEMFRKAWDQGIRGGTNCYSEGNFDFVNQFMMIQLAWDP